MVGSATTTAAAAGSVDSLSKSLAASPAEKNPRRTSAYILGSRVDATSYRAATSQIVEWAARGESRYVIEMPVHMVMEGYRCAENQAAVNGADLVTPGGMPIVWSLRLLGFRGQPRVYGPELTFWVCEAAAQRGLPVGFYGGTDKAVNLMVGRLREKYPGLKVAYVCAPPFRPLSRMEAENTRVAIRQSGCRILFVGLGCPKQERWMKEHRDILPVVMLGVGAAFDFISGEKPQAFPWMQRLGLEWLFRLVTEPKRLWPRYCHDNPWFVLLIARQLAAAFLARGFGGGKHRARNGAGSTEPQSSASVSDIPALRRHLLRSRQQLRLKRVADLWGAAAGLLVLAPVLVLIALLVRLSSRGPVIFRQRRIGYRGKEFVFYKFRSMRVGEAPGISQSQRKAAPQGVLVKMKNDPRVTPIGKVLRWASLDELPQLVNVLRGEMSFVGPRPLMPFMLQPYPELARARSLVRPGITGLWQVRERHNNTAASAMAAHDLEYIRRFNLGLDLRILLETVWVVACRKGAW